MSCSEWKETYIGKIKKEWDVVSLKDCTIKITDGTHSTVKDDPNGEYFLLSCKNIKNGLIVLGEKERKINYETLLKLRARTGLQKGDILLTTVGTIGESAIIKEENINFELQRSVAIIRVNTEILLPDFLYYVTKSRIFKSQADGLVRGSVQKCLFIGAIGEIKIPVPSIEEQEKIVDILSSLDDKVELNNDMNKTLEEMAQSIFKRWFVDFEFPNEDGQSYKSSGGEMVESELGMIPKGWEYGVINDTCEKIYSGGTPKTSEETYWNGELNWMSSGETRNNFIIDTEKYITQQGADKSSTKLANRLNTVIASAGQGFTRGQTSLLLIDTYINQSLITLKPKYYYEFFNYFNIKRRYDELRNISDSHSIRGSLTTKMICKLGTILPSIEVLKEFCVIIEPIIIQIENNIRNSQNIEELRNQLLPKLMNGEIKF